MNDRKIESPIKEGKLYHGIIERWVDPDNRGRYKARIPDLGAYDQQFVVINNTHTWSHSVIDNDTYGSYYPLFPNTNVNVIFKKSGDATSGAIISIIPGGSNKKTNINSKTSSIPFQSTTRDDIYVVMNTKKLNSGLWFFDSSDKYSRSVHLYYNAGASRVIMNDSGINMFTNSKHTTKVESSSFFQTGQNSSETIGVTKHITAGNDIRMFANIDVHSRAENDNYVHAGNRLVMTAQNGSASLYAGNKLYLEGNKLLFGFASEVNFGAAKLIKFKVGSSEIAMTPTDITINGVSLNLFSSKKTAIESVGEANLKGLNTNIGSTASITEIAGTIINLAAAATKASFVDMTGYSIGGSGSTSTIQPAVPNIVDPTELIQVKLRAILDFISIQIPELLPFFGESGIHKLLYTNPPAISLSTLQAKAAAEIDLDEPLTITTA